MTRADEHNISLPAVLLGRSVVVLGCGKVGTAIATGLSAAGLKIAGVTTRSAATAEKAAMRTGAPASTDNADTAPRGDIVFVTTNDDSIAVVAAEVAAADGFRPGQLVLHASGSLPAAVLAPAAAAGASIGCMHPLQSFATPEDAVRRMRGAVFSITCEPESRATLEALVEVLGGKAVPIDDADKALYHAAAVMASNYLVALEDTALGLLERAGFDEESAMKALEPLVTGTAGNVFSLGPTRALTGPIVRGDVETVRGHVEALRKVPGDALELYRALGRRTIEVAMRRGTLSAETVEVLRDVLADEDSAEG
jgi:predicted short-subunit dehydrogenase-like oxidoreductase (DUF2520 family)